jgi:teichuronic acid biosynthesis glycosyltransferase TuaG
LKTGIIAYGLQDVFSYYRRSENTLSANKFEAIKRIWNLYRKVEKLNVFYSVYNFIFYAINAVKRRI